MLKPSYIALVAACVIVQLTKNLLVVIPACIILVAVLSIASTRTRHFDLYCQNVGSDRDSVTREDWFSFVSMKCIELAVFSAIGATIGRVL